MTTKKNYSNGNAEVLANFFTQQLPSIQLQAINVLTSIKYPIHDKQTFCDQVAKTKANEVCKQLVMDIYAPCDFGLDSVYNALEKFTANINRVGTSNAWVANQPTTPNWAWAPNTGTGYGTTNMNTAPMNTAPMNTGYGTSVPVNAWPTATTNVANNWNAWGTATTNAPSMTNVNWEFGNDICGEIACSVFCDMVCNGVSPASAYAVCNTREIACRSIMPNWGNDMMSRRASAIFAHNYIVMGRDVNQCNWCVQFFVNNCVPTASRMTTSNVTGTNYSNAAATRFENKIVESVN